MTALWVALAVALLALAGLAVLRSVRRVGEDERAVMFRLGRVQDGAKGPGLYLLVPFMDEMVKVSLLAVTEELSVRDEQTLDGLRVDARAFVRYRVSDAVKSVMEVEDYATATVYVGHDALSEAIRHASLDELQRDTGSLNERLGEKLGASTRPWGVEIEEVGIEEVRPVK